ncbi:hypothetical protein B0H16DRAFT_310829 [Mycena metata]|uniref:Uncharacterized protein n=1 Tax=Mycena metata TaxID=1033252 RepID=A0AAD7NN91_9AGAR|nr:hypothetical protein B0H16DRAFT_310829 [Mycena metata]
MCDNRSAPRCVGKLWRRRAGGFVGAYESQHAFVPSSPLPESLIMHMQWNSIADGDSKESVRQFGLVLNERLRNLCSQNVIRKYAFTWDIAELFLCSSRQGIDGIYHTFGPSPTVFDEIIPHPSGNGRHIKVFSFECRLEMDEMDESVCATFEHGLEGLFSFPLGPSQGEWYHIRTANGYGVLPSTSTYRLNVGQQYSFHIKWNPSLYPPFEPANLYYPRNAYFDWNVTIPLMIQPVIDAAEAKEPDSLRTIFLQGALKASTSKGKGWA